MLELDNDASSASIIKRAVIFGYVCSQLVCHASNARATTRFAHESLGSETWSML
jgi:hypothetical protein